MLGINVPQTIVAGAVGAGIAFAVITILETIERNTATVTATLAEIY